MARINLLPWRDWERERKKKEFFTNLFGVLVFGGVMLFIAGWTLDNNLEYQNSRNAFLQKEIDALNVRIAEIQTLQKEKKELLARMDVIQQLQGNRPIIVHVFDQLVETLSKGLHFRNLEMSGTELKVSGTAESNNRISGLMRNIDESEWFAQPNLRMIKEDPKNTIYGPQASTFDLTFTRVNPLQKSPNEAEGD
jgi:type IV pilus assembly protein PilN